MIYKRTNENAVSPVIGVILMVSITVILAAVIAAFVFGMAGSMSKSNVVGATAKYTSPNVIEVMYHGGQDAITFQSATVLVVQDNGEVVTYSNGGVLGNSVGNIVDITSATPFVRGQNTVLVVGTFDNQQERVILDLKNF